MLELGTDPRFVVQLHATSRALLSTLDHDLAGSVSGPAITR